MFSTMLVKRPNTEDEETIQQCNLNATKHIDAKNYNEAINLLKISRRLMPKVSTQYPLTQYLRLPLILQKAGRLEEAVNDLESFLEKWNNPFDKALVHDKLRLIYQREGANEEAIEHAVSSLAWECFAYACQKSDFSIYQEPDVWVKKIKALLKKQKKEHYLESIVNKCISFSEEPSEEKIYGLVSFIKEVL